MLTSTGKGASETGKEYSLYGASPLSKGVTKLLAYSRYVLHADARHGILDEPCNISETCFQDISALAGWSVPCSERSGKEQVVNAKSTIRVHPRNILRNSSASQRILLRKRTNMSNNIFKELVILWGSVKSAFGQSKIVKTSPRNL